MTNDAHWLTEVFRRADKEYNDLPEWARPVRTEPLTMAGQDVTNSSDESPPGDSHTIGN